MPGMIDQMKARFDLILPLSLSIAVLVIAIAYWDAASGIGSGSCEYWSNGCGGDYLPWPRDGSGLICTEAIVPMDSIDRLFCLLVATKLYILLVIVQIVTTAWIGRLIAQRILPPTAIEKSDETQI